MATAGFFCIGDMKINSNTAKKWKYTKFYKQENFILIYGCFKAICELCCWVQNIESSVLQSFSAIENNEEFWNITFINNFDILKVFCLIVFKILKSKSEIPIF